MARGGKRKVSAREREPSSRESPPALPPETRTIGQLVAETVRIYQANVWPALALGVLPSIVDVVLAELSGSRSALAVSALVAGPVFTLSYLFGVGIVERVRVQGRPARTALAAGVAVYLPFPFLAALFVLPGLAWLAAFGFVVPVALVEHTGFRASFRRAFELARADFVHVLGGLSTLVIIVVLTQLVVFFLLRGFADAGARVAATLTGIVLTPLLFLGAALLYGDQVARVGSRGRPSRRIDADLPDADHAHGEGGADAQVQSGPPA